MGSGAGASGPLLPTAARTPACPVLALARVCHHGRGLSRGQRWWPGETLRLLGVGGETPQLWATRRVWRSRESDRIWRQGSALGSNGLWAQAGPGDTNPRVGRPDVVECVALSSGWYPRQRVDLPLVAMGLRGLLEWSPPVEGSRWCRWRGQRLEQAPGPRGPGGLLQEGWASGGEGWS